jgi:hypothetical protein
MNTRTILGAACMILVLSGCKQEEGESCQIDDDCEGSLICCKSNPYAIETDRGVCMTREECDTRDTSTDPGVETEEDVPEDPASDEDAREEVTDPSPDPTVEPEDDPVDDPEQEDVPVDEDDPAEETTD